MCSIDELEYQVDRKLRPVLNCPVCGHRAKVIDLEDALDKPLPIECQAKHNPNARNPHCPGDAFLALDAKQRLRVRRLIRMRHELREMRKQVYHLQAKLEKLDPPPLDVPAEPEPITVHDLVTLDFSEMEVRVCAQYYEQFKQAREIRRKLT